MTVRSVLVSLIFLAYASSQAFGQTQPAASPVIDEDDAERDVNLSQPDFTLASLPTTLRVPRHRSSFRITHRFTRALNQGDFGDLLGDLFGLDQGALIGLEYRFGVVTGVQAAIHRSSDKTIQFLGQYSVVQQRREAPLGADLLIAVEGGDNFSEDHATTIGVLLSRELGDRGALYLEPMFVANSSGERFNPDDEENTFMTGLGARLRIRPTVYVMVEATPRLSGFQPGVHQVSVALEKRSGGHMFQLNVSNGFGTTFGQLARGGLKSAGSDDWHLGFCISRKFF